jgi:hypothetical protein
VLAPVIAGDRIVLNPVEDLRLNYDPEFPQDVRFYAIRNASDPQIPDPSADIKAANKTAGEIYSEYGAFTTAASAIASWAVIDAAINKGAAKKSAAKAKARKHK